VMMTNGPAATIGEVLPVPLPPLRQAPRARLALAHDGDYLRTREAVLEFLYSKQAHVETAA
jgi:nitrate/nitrite transport system ATP-binding protein